MERQNQKAGYLAVKLPARSRGIHKVKPWKRRWVVVRQMSDLAAGQTLARINLYADEAAAANPHADKTTIMLENVTAVRRAKSKTHPYAFQIVDTDVCLSLSGNSEGDSQEWMILLRHLLWPVLVPQPEDVYEVSVVDNKDSHRVQLSGNYWLRVTPEAVSLLNTADGRADQAWRLSSLRRFYLATTPHDGDFNHILVIQAGPMSDSGEGEFVFYSPRARDILALIRDSIQVALASRQSGGGHRPRTVSTTSSVLNYRQLLESQESGEIPRESMSLPPSPLDPPPALPLRPLDTPPALPLRPPGTNRSMSLPKNISHLNKASSYSPPKHVTLVRSRRQTEGEISNKRRESQQSSLKTSRSAETFSTYGDLSRGSGSPVIMETGRESPVRGETPDGRDKPRTVSVSSNVSRASGSVTSRDSGIMFSVDKVLSEHEDTNTEETARDTSNSFDSAVSTSCPLDDQVGDSLNTDDVVDSVTSTPKQSSPTSDSAAELDDVLGSADSCSDTSSVQTVKRISVISNIYACIPSRKTSTVSNDYAAIPADEEDAPHVPIKRLHRSRSADRIGEDNDYEELDNFRKDLQKHLDFNPGISKRDEPPALPERPSSTKVVRRQKKMAKSVRASKVASMFGRISRKSGSSSEDDEVNTLISQVHNWPLQGKGSVSDDNDLYTPSDSQAIYYEIRKPAETIVPLDIASSGQHSVSPPFDLISPPPLSSQFNWNSESEATKDLLTSSPTNLSPSIGVDQLMPTRAFFDSSWSANFAQTTPPPPPVRESGAQLHGDPGRVRKRSSTISCPRSNGGCRDSAHDKPEGTECSRSFSEVAGEIFRHSGFPLSSPDPSSDTETYECMSGPQSPDTTSTNTESKTNNDWADFEAFFGSRTPQNSQETTGDNLFTFDDLDLSLKTHTENTSTNGNEAAASANLIDLIDWDSPGTNNDDDTYLDMTPSTVLK